MTSIVAAPPRRSRRPLIGPILPWELTTLARRKRYFALRVIYACVLLFMMWTAYDFAFGDTFFGGPHGQSLTRISRFAAGFYQSFLLTQGIIVLCLTPAFVATALPQEKERKTIEYLFVSDLGNHEIVLGKILARLANLLAILLVGVPVIAFAGLFGGIDYLGLLLGTTATAATMVSIASMSFVVSLYSSTTRAALINAYGMLFFILAGIPAIILIGTSLIASLLLSLDPSLAEPMEKLFQNEWVTYIMGAIALAHPLSLYWLIEMRSFGISFSSTIDVWMAFLALIGIHLAMAACMIAWSIFKLRSSYRFSGTEAPKRTKIKDRVRESIPRWSRPMNENWPLYWKELRSSRFRKLGLLARLLVLIGVVLFYSSVWRIVTSNQIVAEGLSFATAMASNSFIGLGFLIVAFRSASSIGEEKDRDCWISLLATPVTARQIVYSKALGSLASLQPFILLLTPLLLLDLMYGAISLGGIVYWFAGVFAYGFAISCLGVNQSLWQKTTMRAMTMTIVITAVLGGVAQMFMIPMLFFDDDIGKIILASLPWTPLSMAAFLNETRSDFDILILSIFFMIGYVGIGFVLLAQCVVLFGRATGRIESSEPIGGENHYVTERT